MFDFNQVQLGHINFTSKERLGIIYFYNESIHDSFIVFSLLLIFFYFK